LAQAADAECIVPLGQAHTRFVSHQSAMIEVGRMEAQRTIKEKLPGGGFQQIRAANDFGDFHCVIVGNDSELVCRNIIAAPDDEIAEIVAGNIALRSKVLVRK